jgi:solute carrier family 13 (sodium-dependent dicarboxylate transporter), member 2/3/5
VVSNLMSNTAAANLIIPIAMAAAPNQELLVVMGIALGASAAMCLPISTPPNAIVYGTGFLRTRDLIECGLFIALIAPPILLLWLQLQS